MPVANAFWSAAFLGPASIVTAVIFATVMIVRAGLRWMSQPHLLSSDRRFIGCCMLICVGIVVSFGLVLAVIQRSSPSSSRTHDNPAGLHEVHWLGHYAPPDQRRWPRTVQSSSLTGSLR
jgi:hypothetical protein